MRDMADLFIEVSESDCLGIICLLIHCMLKNAITTKPEIYKFSNNLFILLHIINTYSS